MFSHGPDSWPVGCLSAGSTPPGDPAGRRQLGDAWETTGYAFSFDGLHFERCARIAIAVLYPLQKGNDCWIKLPVVIRRNVDNPVMRREADPNVHRNSEPHIFFMPGGNLL
jgi:hypothetical protein